MWACLNAPVLEGRGRILNLIKNRRVQLEAEQNDQCMTSQYRESDERADRSYAFESLSLYCDVLY